MPRVVLSVLSAPDELCIAISGLLAEFGVSGVWAFQPRSINNKQLHSSITLRNQVVPEMVSRLARYSVVAEIEVISKNGSERFLIHPALGIHRQELDALGEVLLRSSAVESLLARTSGNLGEFKRELRRLDGTLWLDLLEPYRTHNTKIILMHKVG